MTNVDEAGKVSLSDKVAPYPAVDTDCLRLRDPDLGDQRQ